VKSPCVSFTTLNRNVTAQEIFDEMGRRQGSQCGLELGWHYVTEEFKAIFHRAYANKPHRQSAEDFARESLTNGRSVQAQYACRQTGAEFWRSCRIGKMACCLLTSQRARIAA
jgi:hypothetical protein